MRDLYQPQGPLRGAQPITIEETNMSNSKQLTLEREELEELGFVEHIWHGADPYLEKVIHVIRYNRDTINGYFSYAPTEDVYKWYHVAKIGEHFNSVCLDVRDYKDLVAVLKVFPRMRAQP